MAAKLNRKQTLAESVRRGWITAEQLAAMGERPPLVTARTTRDRWEREVEFQIESAYWRGVNDGRMQPDPYQVDAMVRGLGDGDGTWRSATDRHARTVAAIRRRDAIDASDPDLVAEMHAATVRTGAALRDRDRQIVQHRDRYARIGNSAETGTNAYVAGWLEMKALLTDDEWSAVRQGLQPQNAAAIEQAARTGRRAA